MSDDHLLMQEIVETHQITVKELASKTGLAACTIYRYLEGAATIPTIIWRILFELTEDPRIWRLVTGDSRRILMVIHGQPKGPVTETTIRELIEVRRRQIALEETILNVLEDGRVDRADQKMIDDLKQDYPLAINAMGSIYYAVMDQYERNGKAKR
jgi:transcriptional regulator with XRE-family HTH domain